jgi:hypothetical protein
VVGPAATAVAVAPAAPAAAAMSERGWTAAAATTHRLGEPPRVPPGGIVWHCAMPPRSGCCCWWVCSSWGELIDSWQVSAAAAAAGGGCDCTRQLGGCASCDNTPTPCLSLLLPCSPSGVHRLLSAAAVAAPTVHARVAVLSTQLGVTAQLLLLRLACCCCCDKRLRPPCNLLLGTWDTCRRGALPTAHCCAEG